MNVLDQLHLLRNRTSSSSSSSSEDRGAGSRPPVPESSRVKRALFGPVDHDENLRFVQRELARNRREAERRWNYDFQNDRPKEGRYEWLYDTKKPGTTTAIATKKPEDEDNTENKTASSILPNLEASSSSSIPAAAASSSRTSQRQSSLTGKNRSSRDPCPHSQVLLIF